MGLLSFKLISNFDRLTKARWLALYATGPVAPSREALACGLVKLGKARRIHYLNRPVNLIGFANTEFDDDGPFLLQPLGLRRVVLFAAVRLRKRLDRSLATMAAGRGGAAGGGGALVTTMGASTGTFTVISGIGTEGGGGGLRSGFGGGGGVSFASSCLMMVVSRIFCAWATML